MRVWLLGVGLMTLLVACGGDGNTQGGDDDITPEIDGGPPDDIDGGGPPPDAEEPGPDAAPPFPFVRCETPTSPLPPLIEDRTVYDQDELDVLEIDLVIDDLAGFANVNANVLDAEVPVTFTEDDYTATGVLRLRGGASRRNAQKNYKVEIADEFSRWRGQREINLNKHMNDMTRVRNKMAFDIFQTVPDFTSLRTRFVHVRINGTDYGLYTWIEEPDKKFLKHHGLDPDGQLYKANLFEFQQLDAGITAIPEMMDAIIDSKGTEDHPKLLRMLEALHAPGLDIDQFFATYFQRDNLVTWLAVNILLNNVDTLTQNFYLYSPSSCEGWYLLPWDYDGAWGFYAQHHDDTRVRWQSGLTNWWVSDLFEEFFKRAANIAAVEAKVAELSQTILTDANTAAYQTRYHDLVQPYVSSAPDYLYMPAYAGGGPSQSQFLWQEEWDRIVTTTSRFFAEFQTVKERPMPTRLNVEWQTPMEFEWKPSFDVQGDPLTYDFQVSRTPAFGPLDLIHDVQDVTVDQWNVADLQPGTYYWRVVVEDHKAADSWQLAYEQYAELIIP